MQIFIQIDSSTFDYLGLKLLGYSIVPKVTEN